MRRIIVATFAISCFLVSYGQTEIDVKSKEKVVATKIWDKLEIPFVSSKTYDNPIYNVKDFKVTFTSPSGRQKTVGGFWLACTTWNGALKSTKEEWDYYLNQRKKNNYNVIQLVTTEWLKSIELPGSIEMGYLAGFVNRLEWWDLFPANEILAEQPGAAQFNHWISVIKSSNSETIVAYIPENGEVVIRNPQGFKYNAESFNPVTNEFSEAKINQVECTKEEKIDFSDGVRSMVAVEKDSKIIEFTQDFENDMLIVLRRK